MKTYPEKRKRDEYIDDDRYAEVDFYGRLLFVLLIPAIGLATLLFLPVLVINALAG